MVGLATAALAGAAAPAPGAALVVAQTGEPRALDPHTVTALNDFRILVNIYEGLVRFADGTLQIEPALAESWRLSDDGRRYTFHLRRGVRFHDGSAFDAAAVAFNFARMRDPQHPWHHTGPFPLAFFFDAIERVEVLDRHTVALQLHAPYAPLLSNLAYPAGLMVSPAAVRRHGRAFGRQPSGTGPFRFLEWRSQRRVVLERYADYHGRPARTRHLVFRPVTDPVTRLAELVTGGVDLASEVPADSIALLRRRPEFTVHERTGPHLWFLILNNRSGPLRDVRVRRAVNLAVDKRAIARDLLQGTAEVAAGPIAAAFGEAADPALEPYPYDPARARALLAAAGLGDGVQVRFAVPQGGSGMLAPVQMATAIQADLAAVGIEARIETFEWNTYLGKVNAGLGEDIDLAAMAWMTNDPDTLLSLALHSDSWPARGGFNSGYYANDEVDRLIVEARTSTDPALRARRYRRIQRLVHDDAPWLFVASWRQNAVTGAYVHGFALQPSFFLDLRRAWKEAAPGERRPRGRRR